MMYRIFHFHRLLSHTTVFSNTLQLSTHCNFTMVSKAYYVKQERWPLRGIFAPKISESYLPVRKNYMGTATVFFSVECSTKGISSCSF